MRAFKPEYVPRFALDTDLRERLARISEFDLEIGAGVGLHAIRYALANPDRTLVAIERTEVKFAGLARRHLGHGSPANLLPLRADAVQFVTHFVAPGRLARVFLLYPNPYPKPKHANLRWYNSPFMSELAQKMARGAELTLSTNLEWYAEGARLGLPAHFDFRLIRERTLDARDPPRTHFEKKYLARGQTCFDLVFARL